MSPFIKVIGLVAALFGVTAYSTSAPPWALMLVGGILAVVCVLAAISHVYLLIKNPDSLRSESFMLAREAMHRGYTGDSIVGLARSEEQDVMPSKMLVNDKASIS